MKKFNSLLFGSMVLSASLVLFSCKKQIAEPLADQLVSSAQANNATQCRPVVFGAYSGQWNTLAQEWYENGKVKYLKAKHGSWTGTIIDPIHEFMFDLNWGEVTYQGNQVYLKDVVDNRMKMRVTLNNQGRPVASYYSYVSGPDSYIHDTTYYYYNGERLDNLISLYEIRYYGPKSFNEWRKYVFSYDTWGNVTKAEFSGHTRLNVQYDYTKPVSNIIGNFHVTSSLKLLEYMELILLPMHHAVTRTNLEIIPDPRTPEYFYESFYAAYKDYVITDGIVKSYVYYGPGTMVTFYNGWECNAGGSVNDSNKPGNGVTSLNQFQDLYLNQKQ